jgi:Uncharacterized conserved protein
MKSDRIRIQHMLDAAREAMGFCAGRSRTHLGADRVLALALVKSIEIVGEAASKVGPELRSRHPEIPWQNIVGMRNRLIHAYFDVDLDRVWDTVTDDLPPLADALDALLKNE